MECIRGLSFKDKKGNITISDEVLVNVDVIVLLFTANEVDKDGVVESFSKYYESAKILNVPIEVVFVSMDEDENNMMKCFESQPSWFALDYKDPTIHVFRFMFEISCIPYLVVIRSDGTVITRQGVADLESYGIDAITTWLSTAEEWKKRQEFMNLMICKLDRECADQNTADGNINSLTKYQLIT